MVWGEKYEGGSDRIVLSLDKYYDRIRVYDPTVGTDPVENLYSVRDVNLTMTNHPLILEFRK